MRSNSLTSIKRLTYKAGALRTGRTQVSQRLSRRTSRGACYGGVFLVLLSLGASVASGAPAPGTDRLKDNLYGVKFIDQNQGWTVGAFGTVYRTIDAAYMDRLDRAFEKKKTLRRQLHDAGATLRLGTDQQQPFTVPGWSLQEEMRIFAEAGIPLESIWTMATRGAGGALGLEGLGEFKPGAPAIPGGRA